MIYYGKGKGNPPLNMKWRTSPVPFWGQRTFAVQQFCAGTVLERRQCNFFSALMREPSAICRGRSRPRGFPENCLAWLLLLLRQRQFASCQLIWRVAV
jgi:hypothetical protein